MNQFLIAAALMTALALLFVLPTLLRKAPPASGQVHSDALNLLVLRDQLRELDADRSAGIISADGYAGARSDLERRVAEDVQAEAPAGAAPVQRRAAIMLALAVPLLAAALYVWLGAPAGLDPAQRAAPADNEHALTDVQIANMVGGLAKKLQSRPKDADGWSMLARSYSVLGRYAESADAYAHLVQLLPDNADVLADYADTLAMAQNKSLQGEPEKLIARALAIDPRHLKALALSASAAFDRHDYAGAVAKWKTIQSIMPPNAEGAADIASSIAEAQALMGMPQQTALPSEAAGGGASLAAQAAVTAPAQAVGAASVGGRVELSPALRAQAADGDTVFIYARADGGARFPLAVLRKQVRDLPLRFTLDDSMGVMPGAKLSGAPMLVVGARISKSGSATPAAGDLEGSVAAVRLGSQDLLIRIDAQHP